MKITTLSLCMANFLLLMAAFFQKDLNGLLFSGFSLIFWTILLVNNK